MHFMLSKCMMPWTYVETSSFNSLLIHAFTLKNGLGM